MPKPILSILDFSFPLASSDLGAETLENEFMLNATRLSQVLPGTVFPHCNFYPCSTFVDYVNIFFLCFLNLTFVNLLLRQIQDRMQAMAHVGLDATSLDDDAFNIEAAQDKCILRLIASCCNSKIF